MCSATPDRRIPQVGFPVAASLDDLPAQRRWNLLWSAGWDRELLLQHPEQFVAVWRRRQQCDPWSHQFGPFPAAHSDQAGLYHLPGMRTEHRCDRGCHDPALLGRAVPAETVPARLRCQQGAPHWPGFQDPGSSTPADRIRYQLGHDLGAMCHACHGRPAVILDHDHHTGLVRGYLCRHCNSRVDGCNHLSGCHLAVYLEASPAARLGIIYPDHARTMRNPRYRARCTLMARYGLQPPWYTAEQPGEGI